MSAKVENTPKGKGPSNGHRNQNSDRKRTEKESGKVGNTEGKRPEKPVKRFQRKRPFLENSTA
ncbi:hypothetical protein ACFV27_39345, partial [Streptomyces antimycoticus]|uniref:hypothetical protein n=2 Tax=Streptomyces violaceusniger group TaxID=2839105 RepID=UPI0033FA97D0